MELRRVMAVLQPSWDGQVKELARRFARAQVSCASCGREEAAALPWRSACRDTIVITDDRALAAELAAAGAVCVGCGAEEGPYFDGAELVTDSPELLEPELLEECLLHAQGRPAVAARTERLVLREIARQDFDALYRISRQEGMEYAQESFGDSCFEPERLAAYVQYAYRLYGYGLWSVLRRDGTLIGCCGLRAWEEPERTAPSCPAEPEQVPLHACPAEQGKTRGEAEARASLEEPERMPPPCPAQRPCLELQYMVAREFQRQGYALEMCRAALAYARERTVCREVRVRIHPENRASLALAVKLGFSDVGISWEGMRLQRLDFAVDAGQGLC